MTLDEFKATQYGIMPDEAEPYSDPVLENNLAQAEVSFEGPDNVTIEALKGCAQKSYAYIGRMYEADAALLGRKIDKRF